jgi:hypothetical protein
MDKFCLYILIKCIFKSVDIIFKLFFKYLNYFEVFKKIEVFLDLFFHPLFSYLLENLHYYGDMWRIFPL